MKLTRGDRSWYLMWSTIIDAPVTRGMAREDFEAWCQDEYGSRAMRDFPDRMARADATGTSYLDRTLNDTIACNRAGEHEACLTMAQLVAQYCPDGGT